MKNFISRNNSVFIIKRKGGRNITHKVVLFLLSRWFSICHKIIFGNYENFWPDTTLQDSNFQNRINTFLV